MIELLKDDLVQKKYEITTIKIDEILLFACNTDADQDLKLLNPHLDL